MPRVKPGERQRAYRPKTLRRIKCDEGKPFCNNCTSVNRQCLGYSHSDSLSGSSRKNQVHSTTSVARLDRDISPALNSTDAEQRAFEYYRSRTSSHLAGIQDQEIWERLILQRARVDPGVRHAIIALASFHEDFERGGFERVKSNEVFGLKQYNLAIKEQINLVTNRNGRAEPEAYLPCIVFMLRSNFTSAALLTKKVIGLLHSLRESNQTSKMLLEFLERRFRQIELQSREMFGYKDYSPASPVPHTETPASIPEVFSSVAEAQAFMDYYGQLYRMALHAYEAATGVTQSKNTTVDEGLSEHDPRRGFAQTYISVLNRWTKAFDALVDSRAGSFTEAEMRTISILRMHQRHNQISLEVSTRHTSPDDQMFWDDYCPVYDQIINLTEEFMASQSRENNTSFSLDQFTIGPIFELARRCRDPRIRRKALKILRACHIREGMWDSELAVLVIERIIAIEEDGAIVQSCQDVPSWRRIFNIQHVLDMEARTIVLKYDRKASATRSVTVQMQEVISW
ncbi:conserved hypothetical protein [Talaromyces stipitatus ATCC 10500]|uniref:Zn(2)-C6 fungal-type domain-containing protein n=1 Tax=Talaromyces stipitatus (strain ATCC 10500 / CBS 375.48 / QM 6759 / NRRL 1006) TaxID=441959 RepID=B8LSX2_TALSN|nr:uncharacterized protein TSTA_064370 [Talaromyces stipitatus ATCC 10500]EED22968.1 conserved hypothetical protein [Talaromyces stipitatus ATCC 10500]